MPPEYILPEHGTKFYLVLIDRCKPEKEKKSNCTKQTDDRIQRHNSKERAPRSDSENIAAINMHDLAILYFSLHHVNFVVNR